MDQYESWLAKQQAMGRPVPVTTAPYYASQKQYEQDCQQVEAEYQHAKAETEKRFPSFFEDMTKAVNGG